MTATAASTESIVRAYFEAFSARRREVTEAMTAEDFRFSSPYDDSIDRQAYFKRCWPAGDGQSGLQIERLIAEGDTAYVTYRIDTRDGLSFRNTECHTVRDGRMVRVEVYFGPSWRDGHFVSAEKENAK